MALRFASEVAAEVTALQLRLVDGSVDRATDEVQRLVADATRPGVALFS